MHKHAKAFHTNKGYKLAIVVFIPTLLFSKYKFVVHFSNVISNENETFHSPSFYMKMNHFNIVFHMT